MDDCEVAWVVYLGRVVGVEGGGGGVEAWRRRQVNPWNGILSPWTCFDV